VLAVGNTTDVDTVTASSQSASILSMLAPGNGVISSADGAFRIMSGTSMAAPHVAGAVAVLGARVPAATPLQLRAALEQTGKQITDTNGIAKPRLRLLSALVSFGDTGFDVSFGGLLKGGKLFSEGVSARNMPASSQQLTISGLQPGDVVKEAHLYFMTEGAGDLDEAVLFQNQLLSGKLLGASRATCTTAGGGAVRVYRANVTSLVPGNGTYAVNGIAPAGVGASLVVVTHDPAAGFTKHVVVRAGALTAQAGETMSHTFLTFPPLTDLDFHVGLGGGDSTSEDAMTIGGLPVFGANAFSGSDGGEWDDRTAFLKGSLAAIQAPNGQLANSLHTGTDCLAWAYAGAAYRLG
jgi:hypothetical protein